MNWGLIVTTLIVSAVVGFGVKGGVAEARWWLTILLFWIAMGFRDYYLKGGL